MMNKNQINLIHRDKDRDRNRETERVRVRKGEGATDWTHAEM